MCNTIQLNSTKTFAKWFTKISNKMLLLHAQLSFAFIRKITASFANVRKFFLNIGINKSVTIQQATQLIEFKIFTR